MTDVKQEIEKFLIENNLNEFLILDDDKSLNGLDQENKKKLILTELMKGFDEEKLYEAKIKIKEHNNE